ncbi:peptidase C14, caspase domain-containing protein [Mycena maculata]|uniref:Peptidase C14, caspase domain-containing protein n=1 Tax=Mycena maculata TaxID=230809 RepID=A0AAD7NT99_9AGAR|nr:peptidase C14, caspase domain-containing protein [Mycena maculata]
MAIDPRPAVVRRTRAPKKKALLIGITYTDSKTQKVLNLPHNDVKQLRQFLTAFYGYSDQDIAILLDKPGEMQPTASNIRQQAAKLVAGAAPGDHFFFFYAGHSVQVPELSTEEHTELDGLDEVMVPSDGLTTNDKLTRKSCLVDNELKRLLVNPLPEGCTMMAVLDTCHSASLLDLDHDQCNGRWSCGMGGQMLSFHNAHQHRGSPPLQSTKAGVRPSVSRKLEFMQDSVFAGHRTTSIPQHRACARLKHTGANMPGNIAIRRCESPLTDPSHMALVTCLSACKDDQITCENVNDKTGGSFTERLLNILRRDPHPRLEDLMKKIYVSIHGMLLDAQTIQQLNNCQDPQMSSETKMDMKAYLQTL